MSLKKENFGSVGILLGGCSRERAVSLRSGQAIYEALRQRGIDVRKIDTANGFIDKLTKKRIDLAFLALHGQGGEDGTIQKILDRRRIPYVGSGPKASAIAFDKARAKEIFLRCGIPTPPYDVVTEKNWKSIVRNWEPPYVIKPATEGSSIGVSLIYETGKGVRALKSAFRRYPVLIIERMIEGREYTVGILGRTSLPVIELRPKRHFYDFKAKYTKGLTEYLIPAPISKKMAKKLQAMAGRAHRTLGLRDFSRVDFRVDAAGRPYVLEVNSIPGFTSTSLLPKAAKEIGINFQELCLTLLRMAQHRKKRHPGQE